ncbi:MAG: caspase family protein, partial [Xanthobacteraceae bacterium]
MGLAGLRSLFIAGISLLAMSVDALADKRVALVVGNSAYQNVAKLPNPSSDAAAIADLLKKSGFSDVALLQDAGNLEFKRAIRRFEDMARDADVAVVFYAGHGIEIGGTNYMIPVDAKLASDLDAQDEAITLDRIVESVDSAKQLSLVILDACRDNPFVASMKRQRQAALRSVSAGLGKVEPTSSGTLIAYAAKAGSTADDGVSDHSPFTTAILKFIA